VIEAVAPVAGVGERFVWEGWSKNGSLYTNSSNLFVIDQPLLIAGNWQKQFLFEFNQQGLPEEYEAFLLVNLKNHSLPFSIWIDEKRTVDYVYPDEIPYGFGMKYILVEPKNQSMLIANSSIAITAIYSFQDNISEFINYGILIIILILLVAIVFLKRRKAI
jgi:hypothetical protein